jgi:bacteriocin-like protein
MDQVVEQVVENKEEVIELSLTELAQVSGGVGNPSLC